MSIEASESIREMGCVSCDRRTIFEQPPCTDGHAECDEWLCTRCGIAVLAGSPVAVVVEPAPPVTAAA